MMMLGWRQRWRRGILGKKKKKNPDENFSMTTVLNYRARKGF